MAPLDDGDDGDDALVRFLPPVAAWFRDALGDPTPAQRLGWPAIAAGQNTLIVRAHRIGQDPGGVPGGARLALEDPPARSGRADPLCFAAQGSQ